MRHTRDWDDWRSAESDWSEGWGWGSGSGWGSGLGSGSGEGWGSGSGDGDGSGWGSGWGSGSGSGWGWGSGSGEGYGYGDETTTGAERQGSDDMSNEIDSLTLGQIKQAAQVAASMGLGGSAASPFAPYVGSNVIVRSHMSGVWWGKVVRCGPDWLELGAGARKLHYWTQSGACEGLSVQGPGPDSRVTVPTPGPKLLGAAAQIVDIGTTTPEADEVIVNYEHWTGR